MSRKRYTFEHWQIVAVYLMIYDILAVNLSYLFVLWMRFDCAFSQIPSVYFHAFLKIAPWHTAFSLFVFWRLRLYKSIWRYAGYSELLRVTSATALTGMFYILALTIFKEKMPVSCYLFGPLVQFCLTVGIRFSYRFVVLERIRKTKSENSSDKRILLIGAGNAGKLILRDIIRSREDVGTVKCIIDDEPNKWGRYMEGVPIVGGRDDISPR